MHILLAASVIFYALILCLWFLLRQLYGDTPAWLAIANTLALYLFLPLPILLVLVLVSRRRVLLVPLAVPLALFLWLFGGYFIPHSPQADASQPTLRVLTFNMNGNAPRPDVPIRHIAKQDADLVLLQELSPRHADIINSLLANQYPYRALHPIPGRHGIGILSKYPFQDEGLTRLGSDSTALERVMLDWNGTPIEVLNVHLASTMPGDNVSDTFRERETQVRQLVDLLRASKLPILLAGDFNMTDTTQTYGWLMKEAQDAHTAAGWGPGLTFPASRDLVTRLVAAGLASVLKTRTNLIAGYTQYLPIQPQPLLRIDYIFSTPPLRAVSVETTSWDGQSDHRAVSASFQMSP